MFASLSKIEIKNGSYRPRGYLEIRQILLRAANISCPGHDYIVMLRLTEFELKPHDLFLGDIFT